MFGFLLIFVSFVIGALLAGGTVLEGIGLFFGVSIGLVLLKCIFGMIMQYREDRNNGI